DCRRSIGSFEELASAEITALGGAIARTDEVVSELDPFACELRAEPFEPTDLSGDAGRQRDVPDPLVLRIDECACRALTTRHFVRDDRRHLPVFVVTVDEHAGYVLDEIRHLDPAVPGHRQ